jgi:hypothetical protein
MFDYETSFWKEGDEVTKRNFTSYTFSKLDEAKAYMRCSKMAYIFDRENDIHKYINQALDNVKEVEKVVEELKIEKHRMRLQFREIVDTALETADYHLTMGRRSTPITLLSKKLFDAAIDLYRKYDTGICEEHVHFLREKIKKLYDTDLDFDVR